MYHRKKGRKLGRRPDHRTAMLRNLALSLITEERVETTVARAKELRRVADRLITYAKRGDLHGRRLIISALGNQPEAAAKVIDDIAPRYAKRNGGYTRVLKTGFRRGDAAATALIEWVEQELPQRTKKKKPKPATKVTMPEQSEPETAVAASELDAPTESGEAPAANPPAHETGDSTEAESSQHKS